MGNKQPQRVCVAVIEECDGDLEEKEEKEDYLGLSV